jgi:hypothetical protein
MSDFDYAKLITEELEKRRRDLSEQRKKQEKQILKPRSVTTSRTTSRAAPFSSKELDERIKLAKMNAQRNQKLSPKKLSPKKLSPKKRSSLRRASERKRITTPKRITMNPQRMEDGLIHSVEKLVSDEIAVAQLPMNTPHLIPSTSNFYLPRFLNDFHFQIFHSVPDGTCLLHSILLATSPSYRRLSQQNKSLVGNAVRRRLYSEQDVPFQPGTQFMTDASLRYFCDRFGFNCVLMESGVRFNYYAQHDAPFILVYHSGDHYDGMTSNNKFFLNQAAFNHLYYLVEINYSDDQPLVNTWTNLRTYHYKDF